MLKNYDNKYEVKSNDEIILRGRFDRVKLTRPSTDRASTWQQVKL